MKILPNQPNLEFLRRKAQTLKSRHRVRDESVVELIRHFDTSMHGFSQEAVFSKRFSAPDAQRVTARQYCFSSWARLKLFVEKSSTQLDDYNVELRDTILKRKVEYDAQLKRSKRMKWKNGAIKKWDKFNEESGELFKDVYRQYGWPGPNIVGREAVDACFYLTVSHVYDSEFQHMTASMMKDALPKGECFGLFYAQIIDRNLALTNKPTLYGTTSDYNIETGRVEGTRDIVDPKNVNKRRAEVGLPNLEASNREYNEDLTKKKLHQTDRNAWESYKRKTALKGGYIQSTAQSITP